MTNCKQNQNIQKKQPKQKVSNHCESIAVLNIDKSDTFIAGTQLSSLLPSISGFVERKEVVQKIVDSICNETNSSDVAITGIHGMGGVGKTSIAKMVCHHPQVTKRFKDGIEWITLGENISEIGIIDRLTEILRFLGDENTHISDIQRGKEVIRKWILSKKKNCLIVLDDVWTEEQKTSFDLFEDATQTKSRILLTTRNSGMVKQCGAIEHKIDLLTDNESLAILQKWRGKPITKEEQQFANLIIKECAG